MATPSLRKLWAQIEGDLRRAEQLLPSSAANHNSVVEYRTYLDHNELELACDMLEHYAEEHQVNDAFWLALADAADKMELTDRAAYYRSEAGAG
ncbi:hypothetical protein [Posidoniimonas polymericola]|uniref:hypothetical protein n=1 Tax=Posidoniimonas polymericola TaxID=2528002 RepID=UPI0011B50914|nr:hypothetical protein [Posidoniimonas polymericola]